MSADAETPATMATASPAAPLVDTTKSPFCRLRPLSLSAVQLTDQFWEPRRQQNRAVTLPAQHQQCVETGRLDNFRRVVGQIDSPFQGRFYNDSDVYKWLEAAAWTLATDADPVLAAQVDEDIALIAAAQDADGYLNTYFTFERAAERWTDLAVMHELYCAGHLIQAAIAHHRATGTHTLLDVAIRLADYIGTVFGPTARLGACGHPEIELALVELTRETGDQRYLAQARFFLDQRGQTPPVISGQPYHQDHAPLREQREVVGHAVRALYLYTGAADVYAETGEPALLDTCLALWDNFQQRKAYITGGAGARYQGEAFGDDYELPNDRAYAETCAAIASVMWNWRLLLITGQARFADALETALYNGVLAGLALDGAHYFYQNPLADGGRHRRQPWFGTACCPPNLARLLASLPGYVYTTSTAGIQVHLYATSDATVPLPDDQTIAIAQQTAYPWQDRIALTLHPTTPVDFTLALRVPSWAAGATVQVNAEPATPAQTGYVELQRRWRAHDTVILTLPLPPRLLISHPRVENNLGRVALLRGPLVYCIEGADHPDTDVRDLVLPASPAWRTCWEPDLLGGVVTLRTTALARTDSGPVGQLYRPYSEDRPQYRESPLTAIPYYAWANREPGPMQVWLPVEPTG